MNTALVQVLGAVSYGELKAHEGAKADAAAAPDADTRLRLRKVAAEELRHHKGFVARLEALGAAEDLRHHKGFVARLEALGADPERAMRPYRAALDRYHGRAPSDRLSEAVFDYLGEGVADDLLRWLRIVVDDDTAAFIDTVIEDEVEHEAAAAAELRRLIESTPGARARVARASRRMLVDMIWSARDRAVPMVAFLRIGRPVDLLSALIGGHIRRMRAIGFGPLGLPTP